MKLLNELIKLSSHFVKFEHSESDSEAELNSQKISMGETP